VNDQPDDPPGTEVLAGGGQGGEATAGAIVLLRGKPVVPDARVAQAFGVETREINQALSRNPHKFTEEHAFQVTAEERDFLTSQGVIPKPGRGGSRTPPHVYTQKGVARLATILDTPRALAATDLMIDLFVDVYQQIAQGRRQVFITQPGRLTPEAGLGERLQGIRTQLLKAIDTLLKTEITPGSKTTVADEIGELAQGAIGFAKAHLNAKGIENEKIAAETVQILEKAREIRDRTRADVAKSQAETERVMLENFEKKLAIVEKLWAMADKLEPNALVTLSQGFVKPSLFLQAPQPAFPNPAADAEKD
jgi:hypothetical protein